MYHLTSFFNGIISLGPVSHSTWIVMIAEGGFGKSFFLSSGNSSGLEVL